MPAAVLAILLLGLACGPADSLPSKGSKTGASSLLVAGEDFGGGITLSHVTDFADILSDPDAYADQLVLTRARVYDVCQKKGCWMVLREGNEQVRISFEDYGFFVPKDCTGQLAYVEGHVHSELLSERTARHYASESARSAAEGDELEGPRRITRLIARGVRLARP